MPHDKDHVLATVHKGSAAPRRQAIKAAAEAWEDWHRTPWEDRAAVFLRAAELLAGPVALDAQRRDDARAVEDRAPGGDRRRVRARRTSSASTCSSCCGSTRSSRAPSPGTWNRMEYRPLEGFVFAVTPFNFTAIGGNLPASAALMGNTVVWKPASTAAYSAHFLMKLFEEAGLPPGRDQPRLRLGLRDRRSRARKPRPRRRALHRLDPRLPVDVEDDRRQHRATTATIRASSARPAARTSSSRIPLPTPRPSPRRSSAAASSTRARSAPPPRASSRRRTSGRRSENGSSRRSARSRWATSADFQNFMGAVIDAGSFKTQKEAIEEAKASDKVKVLVGGGYDDSEGYFVEPTVLETHGPELPHDAGGALRARRHDLRLPGETSTARRSTSSTRARPTASPAPSSRASSTRSSSPTRSSGTRPGTST